MSNSKIKVAGYSKKEIINGDVEWRPFSPDLVGLQLTSNGGTPLFTMGNFNVTTNFDPKLDKTFISKSFSNFTTLLDLNLTLEETQKLLNNNGVILNLDKRDLSNYALFGSLKESIRVALENIITNWPAGILVSPVYQELPDYNSVSGYTVENYIYDRVTNTASFSTFINNSTNQYQINLLKDGSLSGTFNETNELRNLVSTFSSYVLTHSNIDFPIIGFTGATNSTNDYLYFTVTGNPFTGNTNDFYTYFIKPNESIQNNFFNSLPDLEYYLLNRLVEPKYTANFNFTIKSNSGDILYVNKDFTWPTTDGYNLDFDTDEYNDYATKLLDTTIDYDLTISNLIVRFLVANSITDFDTTSANLNDIDSDNTDQKINKTLTIYGIEFDKINSFIKGISFANSVSYDKNNNTPDIYLKNIGRVLGWDVINSIVENDLLNSFVNPKASTYSGQSIGLTPVEADIELWRRIILNTPWIWKSKGTRKVIEFLFKFIGTPQGLITFNEYIYLAENRIDIELFEELLRLNNLDDDISKYPISLSGFPNPLPNTPDMYFQNNGQWYRETGGANSTIDITTGNNPHVGQYDGGYKYINQFRKLIPNFSAVTVTSNTITTTSSNLFTNYNYGTMTTYSGDTYVDIESVDGVDFSNCYVVTSSIIEDPKSRKDSTDCGCDSLNTLNSLSICIDSNQSIKDCNSNVASISFNQQLGNYNYNLYQYNPDGSVYTVNNIPVYNTTEFYDKKCCEASGLIPYFYNKRDTDGTLINTGYICCNQNNSCGCLSTCKFRLDVEKIRIIADVNQVRKFLLFNNEFGEKTITSKDGCNCIARFTTPTQVFDPYTNEIGIGCLLTKDGDLDIRFGQPSIIVETYNDRANGLIGCNDIHTSNADTFMVILNNSSDIGMTINPFGFTDLNQITKTERYLNKTILTSPVGYISELTDIKNKPNYGDTVRMEITRLPNSGGVYTNYFDPNLGHKMHYLISNIKYDITNFWQAIPNMVDITPIYNLRNNNGLNYCGEFKFSSIGSPTYIYMIWDFRT